MNNSNEQEYTSTDQKISSNASTSTSNEQVNSSKGSTCISNEQVNSLKSGGNDSSELDISSKAPSSTSIEKEQILKIAVRAGEMLLKNGAETYRVEETMTRICLAYGYTCESFVLPTGVFASISDDYSSATTVLRNKVRAINLGRVASLNTFARNIVETTPSYKEAMQHLDKIAEQKIYSKRVIFVSYTLTAAIFSLLFEGTWLDATVALFIGMALALIRLVFMRRFRFPFLEYFLGGSVAGFLGFMASQALQNVYITQSASTFISAGSFQGINAYIVIAGSLINLMPGTALVSGVRDMMYGDSVSGQARLGEALLMVAILAAGAAVGFGGGSGIIGFIGL